MQGRYFDGLDSTAHAAEVRFEGGNLIIEAGGQTHVWSATGLFVDVHADQARVSRRGGDARLVMTAADWTGWLQASARCAATPPLVGRA